MDSLGRTLQIDLPRDWASLALHRDVWRGVVSRCWVLSSFILFSSFPLLLAFVVGDLGFEFCVFVAGWRHALRGEWPFIIIIITDSGPDLYKYVWYVVYRCIHNHQLPISVMTKERRLRWLGHAARRSDNNMVKQLVLLRGYPDMCNLLDGLVALGCIMLWGMWRKWDSKA